MMTASKLLERAAASRDLAGRVARFADALEGLERLNLLRYSTELQDRACELEREAAAIASGEAADAYVGHANDA